jgi:hypothetical protein
MAGIPRALDDLLEAANLWFVFPGEALCLQSLKVGPEGFIQLLASSHVLLGVRASFFLLGRTLFFGGLMFVFVYVFHDYQHESSWSGFCR